MYNKSLTHQYVSSDNTISLQVNYKTLPQYSGFFSSFCPICNCSLFYNLHVLNPIIHSNFCFLHTVNCPSKRFTIRKQKTLFIIFITLYSSVQILFAYFPSVPRTCFNTFCNAGLLVMNCLRFCLSKKINTLPSIKKYIFAGYTNVIL